MKKAFTLAEMMVVLAVIGILTAIILPNAYKVSPDENIMKFKKGYSTLGNVIRELATSDQYFHETDCFAKKPNGTEITSATYFCEAIADLVSARSVNCQSTVVSGCDHVCSDWSNFRDSIDSACATAQSSVGSGEIITTDGIIYYNASPGTHFNSTIGDVEKGFINAVDADGLKRCMKVVCFDVDGLNSGEAPFGFGVRVDGKMYVGTRAKEWAKKDASHSELD